MDDHGPLDGFVSFVDRFCGDDEPQRAPRAAPSAPLWSVYEMLDENGSTLWIVTDGRESAECRSRDLAERIARALAA